MKSWYRGSLHSCKTLRRPVRQLAAAVLPVSALNRELHFRLRFLEISLIILVKSVSRYSWHLEFGSKVKVLDCSILHRIQVSLNFKTKVRPILLLVLLLAAVSEALDPYKVFDHNSSVSHFVTGSRSQKGCIRTRDQESFSPQKLEGPSRQGS